MMSGTSGRPDICTPFQQWFQKAASVDVAWRCELLWTEKENPFYDTTVKVLAHEDEPEQSYRAHKLILAMGSRKFASKLYESSECSGMADNDGSFIVEIDSLSASVVKLVLEYLYTDNIKESLKWPVVGGLCHAAKELEIPKLAEHCEYLLDKDLSCEDILVLFQQICTIQELKFPKYYYIELLGLCYSYILRNGEVILRSKTFVELTFDQVEQLISSDFLIVYEELSVYNALKRWAKRQCQDQEIDAKDIHNYQKVLRVISEDDLGLLRHVRFLHMESDLEVPSNLRKSVIPETVYQCQILGEPSNVFSEKPRHAQINDQNVADFREHVRTLTDSTIAKLPIFRNNVKSSVKIGETVTPSNHSQTRQKSKSSPNTNSEMKPRLDREKHKTTPKTPPPCSTNIVSTPSVTTKQEIKRNYHNIKTEPNSDAEEDGYNETPVNPVTLSANIKSQSTPLRVINGNTSPLKRKGMINKTNEIIKSRRLALEDINSSVSSTPTPSPNIWTQNNARSTGSRHEESYYRKLQKLRFLKIIEDCSSLPNLKKIILEDVEIEGLKLKRLPSICLPKMTDFIVNANIGNTRKSTVFQILKGMSLEHFVFFYREDESLEFRLSDLWSCNDVNVKVSFNEIIVLRICSFGLTLNYTKNSSFFALNAQSLSQIRTLNLGNCAIHNQFWLQEEYAKNLVHLRLIQVNNLKIDKILRECNLLETFSLWPLQTQTPVLCLNDFRTDRLCSLSIQSRVIKINAAENRSFTRLTEMCLMDCSWDPDFTDMIPKLFPNLRNFLIINRFTQPRSDLLKVLLSLKNMEEIGVWNFDEKSLNNDKDSDAKSLLSRLKLKTRTNELNFILKRELNGDWKGVSITRKDIPKKIYDSFGFENFYSYDAWTKHFWASYDYY